MVWDPDGAHDHKDEGVHVRGLGNCCEQAAVAVVQMKRQGARVQRWERGAPDMTPGSMASHQLLVRQAMAAVLHRLRGSIGARIEHNRWQCRCH